ncbi:MAG: helicase HerA-like domain-containing protein [Clostridium sp.]
MYFENRIWIAKSGDEKIGILPEMANRHGLIAGATGTGKTITLKVMAESFSDCGVPVFLADVKGDLAGMCKPGVDSDDMKKRIQKFGLAETGFAYKNYPTCFWDIFGKNGLPLRTTISEMGPTLLARLMDLNQTQSDILSIIFKIADDDGLLLIDTKDLRSMLQYIGNHSSDYSSQYGNMSKQSINTIVRSVVALEAQGGDQFFGEPALDIHDWIRTDSSGKGMINILDSRSVINTPLMYSTFMLWMMSELFEILPEAGDSSKPKMVFFFDEAHLLFNSAPKALLEKIEQVVKLVRSKGVGIYFISQNPSDIPDEVLSQLGNRIQHALRAYTPSDLKKVKAAAQSFRANPAFDTEKAITELGIGEALVSFLDEKGSPSVVKRSFILPPQSQMGPIPDEDRKKEIDENVLFSRYASMEDRDSAYEFFQRKKKQTDAETQKTQAAAEQADTAAQQEKAARLTEKEDARAAKEAEKEAAAAARAKKKAMAPVARVAKSAVGTIGREVGNELGKKVGGSFGKRLGGNIGSQLCRGILDTLFGN